MSWYASVRIYKAQAIAGCLALRISSTCMQYPNHSYLQISLLFWYSCCLWLFWTSNVKLNIIASEFAMGSSIFVDYCGLNFFYISWILSPCICCSYIVCLTANTDHYFRTRLVAVATQKFVAEVAGDALQYVHFIFPPTPPKTNKKKKN